MIPKRARRVRGLVGTLLVLGAAHWVSADCAATSSENDATHTDPARVEFFATKVQPILQARCLKCHGGESKVRSNFRVDSRAAVLRGGDLGPAITLDRPEESLLLQAIHYEGLEMPPAGKLPAAEIDVLTRWVKEGLAWPAVERPAVVPAATAPASARASARWSYLQVVRPALPQVKNQSWVRNPIDAFLLARLESDGIAAGAAGRSGRPDPTADL